MNRYFRVCICVFAFAAIQFSGFERASADGAAPVSRLRPYLTIDVPIQELIDGYHDWVTSHPTARIKPIPIPGTTDVAGRQHFVIKSFSIDLYGKDGVSLLHGIDSSENATFIRGLPHDIPKVPTADETRPTLIEAIAMFKELKPYLGTYAASHQYVLFSIQNLAKIGGSPQNEALQEVKLRAGQGKFLVIDLRFHD